MTVSDLSDMEKSQNNTSAAPSRDERSSDVEASVTPALPTGGRRRQTRGFMWFLVVSAIMSSMFTQSLDNTITADLVPDIINTYRSVDLMPWVSVGYMFGAFVALLPLGKLYERVNNKHLYIVSIVVFTAASALCGAAPTMPAMIVGRVLLGVGGSGLYCGIMTLITRLTDDHELPLYFAITGVVWCIGTVLGPVVGGGFASINHTTWRWSFYINIIIGGLFLPVYLWVLPSVDPLADERPAPPKLAARVRHFDWLGTLLLTGSTVCIIMSINFGGVLYAWNSGPIIAMFVVGFVLAIVFGVQQRLAFMTTTEDRIFPAPLLAHKESALLFASTICSNAAALVPIYHIPLYFQFTRGDSPLQAAVRLMPLIVLFGAANLAQGVFLIRVGYYWPWFMVGGAMALAGNVMLYMIDVNTSTGYIYGAEVIMAIGVGLCNQTPYGVIHRVIAPEHMTLGVPFIMIAQYTGITFSLSISGAVFVNEGLKGLRNLLPDIPADQLSGILSGTSSTGIDVVPLEMRAAVIDVIVEHLRKTFITAFAGAAGVLLISIFYRKQKMAGGGAAAMVG
jgi:MFS family permease